MEKKIIKLLGMAITLKIRVHGCSGKYYNGKWGTEKALKPVALYCSNRAFPTTGKL